MIILLLQGISAEQCKNRANLGLSVHSHLDIYWLNNYDELKTRGFMMWDFLRQMNQRSSGQIFDQALQASKYNPQFKYFISQVYFFWDWYIYLSKQQKELVKTLLQSGSWEIVGGAWAQQDQACTYYDDLIEMHTLGMQFLHQEFGYKVHTGWNTDSFGHSSSNVAVMSLMGIQNFGFQRVDQNYIMDGKPLEFVWVPTSRSNNLTYGSVRTHLRFFLHQFYSPMNDNSPSEDLYNIILAEQKYYKKDNLFKFYGNDFQMFPAEEFSLIDQMLKTINKTKNCTTASWMNPTQYFNLTRNQTWPMSTSDFMPNWDHGYYWTGYFTTGPQLKKQFRDGSRLLNMARKYFLLKGKMNRETLKMLRNMESNLSIAQHHDGITYTSKEVVYSHLFNYFRSAVHQIENRIIRDFNADGIQITKLHYESTWIELKSKAAKFMFVLRNFGMTKSFLLKFEFSSQKYLKGDSVCLQQSCFLFSFVTLDSRQTKILTFQKDSNKPDQMKEASFDSQLKIGQLTIKFNQTDMKIVQDDKWVSVSFFFSNPTYESYETRYMNRLGTILKDRKTSANGKYIMGNTGQKVMINLKKVHYHFFNKSGLAFFRLQYSKNQMAKLNLDLLVHADGTIELLHQCQMQNQGDLFVQYSSSITSSQLYHDSNGYLVQKRVFDKRDSYTPKMQKFDKINGNTFPATAFAYLRDQTYKLTLGLDRSEGVTVTDSMGTFYANLDRNANDDYKGVGQGYYIRPVQRIRHLLKFSRPNEFPERIWQRDYDDPVLVGQAIAKELSMERFEQKGVENKEKEFIKQNVVFLSEEKILLRVQNLHDLLNGTYSLFRGDRKQKRLALTGYKVHSIKEVSANGLTTINQKVQEQIGLQALQIRSFQITTSQGLKCND